MLSKQWRQDVGRGRWVKVPRFLKNIPVEKLITVNNNIAFKRDTKS